MTEVLLVAQIIFLVVMTMYLLGTKKSEKEKKNAFIESARAEGEKLMKMREISLTEPLSEKTRPKLLDEIIGQEEGIKALTAALCGKNPQHIIIYGPPGVGKTCAARIALEYAKASKGTPFRYDAKFVELDATCVRFDERAIADPLIGSVHDPIYQGAGSYGQAGIPQPKPGAVTKAHGGVLFLDEIGELHPIQMNKLLKVMEDRRVYFDSAYYSSEDQHLPPYIHDVFTNGMPADFRLIGATTRMPHELPPAIRSRCIEVFFRPLYEEELQQIAENAVKSAGLFITKDAAKLVARYSANGRDAVNIVQMAIGIAASKEQEMIEQSNIEWILNAGRYHARQECVVAHKKKIGCVNGMGVSQNGEGFLIEIESVATPVNKGEGRLSIAGFAEQEQTNGGVRMLSRRSTALASIENVLAVLKKHFFLPVSDYDIHINASGGMMVDGPSAGIAIAACVYSSLTGVPIRDDIAFTGEITLLGDVRPVGGVMQKTEAARRAGITTVFVPERNRRECDGSIKKVIPVTTVFELFNAVFPSANCKKTAVNDNIGVCKAQ